MELKNTVLYGAYLHDLVWLSRTVVDACEAVFSEAKVPESGYALQVSPKVHANINSALVAAANIKKLTTESKKRKGESALDHSFRRRRARDLADLLSGLSLDELLNTKVRNSLEHFDEDLDQANREMSGAAAPPAQMAAYNMTLSHWKALNPRVFPLRLYVAIERRFYNMKHSIDLQALHDQAAAIADRLGPRVVPGNNGDPGGLLIPLHRKVAG